MGEGSNYSEHNSEYDGSMVMPQLAFENSGDEMQKNMCSLHERDKRKKTHSFLFALIFSEFTILKGKWSRARSLPWTAGSISIFFVSPCSSFFGPQTSEIVQEHRLPAHLRSFWNDLSFRAGHVQ